MMMYLSDFSSTTGGEWPLYLLLAPNINPQHGLETLATWFGNLSMHTHPIDTTTVHTMPHQVNRSLVKMI